MEERIDDWIEVKDYKDFVQGYCWVYTNKGNIYNNIEYIHAWSICYTEEVTHYNPIPKPDKPI